MVDGWEEGARSDSVCGASGCSPPSLSSSSRRLDFFTAFGTEDRAAATGAGAGAEAEAEAGVAGLYPSAAIAASAAATVAAFFFAWSAPALSSPNVFVLFTSRLYLA